MTTVHVTISGRVQGVGYRAWTVDAARKLGLKGWVRNCGNGTVEAMFQGDDLKVHQMIEQCHEGPYMARVTDFSVSEEKVSGEIYVAFTAKPSF